MPSESINYDRAADYYDETRGHPEDIVDDMMAFIAQKALLKHKTHLLEIGIGTGRMSVPLSAHVGQITGVDISSKMMAKLQEKSTETPIQLAQSNAEKLPFTSRSFDRVLISHVLHLVPDPNAVLDEVSRVLKRPGQLIHSRHIHNPSVEFQPMIDAWNRIRRSPKDGPANWHKSDEFLTENPNWYMMEEHRFIYPDSDNPKRFLEYVKNRWWSNTWHMSPDEANLAYDRMRLVAEETYGENYDIELETTSGIQLQIFVPTG